MNTGTPHPSRNQGKILKSPGIERVKPKSFVTWPFIGFGMSPWLLNIMSPWLLGTDSGGPHPSRIPY